MSKFRVEMHTKPGPGSEFYEGYVDVEADSVEEAKEAAINKLARGAFRDRGRGAWKVDRVSVC